MFGVLISSHLINIYHMFVDMFVDMFVHVHPG